MRSLSRAAACLAALLVVASCTAPTSATQISRDAPDELLSEVSRSASARDLGCLAEAVYFEARGTGAVGESAVAHVVVNRAKSSEFPNSVCGVVGDGCQFSYRCDGLSDTLADPRARAHAYKVAETVLAGAPDITDGALFFHSARVSPGWFKTRPRVGTFGGNVFYR